MRGQSGLEYIAILGLMLAVFLPLALYLSSTTNTSMRVSRAKQATETIGDKANEIHSLGGKMTIDVELPEGIREAYVRNQSVVMTLSMGDVNSSAVYMVNPGTQLNGTIPTSAGWHKITIEKINQTHVDIRKLKYD